MKTLLTITAMIEAATGVGLTIAPSWAASALLGAPFDSPAALVIGRVLGAALFSLGTACWLARSRPAADLVAAMLIYNVATVSVLGYARIGLGLSGVGLWPGFILHSGLAAWCLACRRLPSGHGE